MTAVQISAVYRPHWDGSDEMQLLSYGTVHMGAWGEGPAEPVEELAARRARDTRITHSYSGPLTVYVWDAREDEHYRMPVPHDAQVFEFETAEPPRSSAPVGFHDRA